MTRSAKRVTSQDVARDAGVSRTTVSFILNDKPGLSIPEETRRRVLDAAKRLDYRPHASARSLASGRSDVVLLSIPDLPIGSGISRFVEELAAALADHGLTLVTHLAGAHGRPLPDVCATVGASVVIGLEAFDEEAIAALHRAGAQVVLPSGPDHAHVMAPIGRLQAEHLIGLGHTRLGYAMPAHPGLRQMGEDRLRGVTGACLEAEINPPLVLSTCLEIAGAFQSVTRWLEGSITAVCAFNDETAIAILAGLRELNLTAPTDLAVIGADDIPTARLAAPPLTTVFFDLHEASRRRAEAVVAALAGREPQPTLNSGTPHVIRRSST